MFQLPTCSSDGAFPLFDHSAIAILTALVCDDLDDQNDTLVELLKVDPVFASWVVNEAAVRDGVELTSCHLASRWVGKRFLQLVSADDFKLTHCSAGSSHGFWQSFVSTSINASNHARNVLDLGGAAGEQAAWWALLCCMKRQVDSLSKLNGHSPLQGVAWHSPVWVWALDQDLKECRTKDHPKYAANSAINSTHSADTRWLGDSDVVALTADYGPAKRLVPGMLAKLSRCWQLDQEFAHTLLQEKMAAMQQLAYGASHEINNPLANISTRAQTLLQGEQDADRRRKLTAINDQAFRAYEMIADLMLFAKPPKLNMVAVNVQGLLHQIRDELEGHSDLQRIVCRLAMCDELVEIVGDPLHLSVAVKAICKNALEAMDGQGEIRIGLTKSEPGWVEVSIEDTGRGLNEPARRHLFDPFFSGREAGRGMGFGLSKAWRIVEQHRGRISVSSVPNRGSCFTISLPEKP